MCIRDSNVTNSTQKRNKIFYSIRLTLLDVLLQELSVQFWPGCLSHLMSMNFGFHLFVHSQHETSTVERKEPIFIYNANSLSSF